MANQYIILWYDISTEQFIRMFSNWDTSLVRVSYK